MGPVVVRGCTACCAVRSGKAGEIIGRILETIKPETAYFGEQDGKRGGIFIINVQTPSDIPFFAEPFFLNFEASCKFRVLMSPEDLQKAGTYHLVAISGGPDSTALLAALVRLAARLGISVEAAVVDHGLRPAVQRIDHRLHFFGQRFGISIFGFEMLNDLGIAFLAKPEIVIRAAIAVVLENLRVNGGDGGLDLGEKGGSHGGGQGNG
jgi:hypothetical protein